MVYLGQPHPQALNVHVLGPCNVPCYLLLHIALLRMNDDDDELVMDSAIGLESWRAMHAAEKDFMIYKKNSYLFTNETFFSFF